MTLSLRTLWEYDIFGRTEGSSHLVISLQVTDQPPSHRAPVDIAFALDRSGSMRGENKLELVKEAVLASIACLKPSDRIALVTFDDTVQVDHYLTDLEVDHVRHLKRVTRAIQCGGSTNLHGGWWEACNQLAMHKDETRIKRSLLLTDGMANMGETNPMRLAAFATQMRERGISTSSIGVGMGFDEMLLSSISESGGGNFQFIAHASELEAFFDREIASLVSSVAVKPYLDITLPAGFTATLVNSFPHQRHEHGLSVDLRDLSAGEKLSLVVEVTSRFVRDSAESIQPMMHLHWTDPGTGKTMEIDEPAASIAIGNAETARRNDEAAVIVMSAVSAREQREAIRLDREGRFRESRQRYQDLNARLMSAPDSAEMQELRDDTAKMAKMSASAPLSEMIRKGEIHRAHARSRGKQ